MADPVAFEAQVEQLFSTVILEEDAAEGEQTQCTTSEESRRQ